MTADTAAEPGAARADLVVGGWRVDRAGNAISRGTQSVKLEPKAIELLAYLAQRPGEVVAREELLAALWPGVIVGDDALTQAIIKLRKALGDDAHRPKYIETISKRGYRLIAPVDNAAKPQGRAPRPRRVLLAAGMLALVLIAVALVVPLRKGSWPLGGADAPPGPSRPVIAVLPLENLSGDAQRQYFSDGLTEDIISALGRFSALRVLSLNAVRARPGAASPASLAEALGARYIVKGSVREAAGRLRVAVELSDAAKATVLWSERYEGEGRDIFDIQDRIVRSIAGALAVRLTRIERERSAARPVDTLEAYDLVLRARELTAKLTRDTNRQARELLARAADLAPNYGEVYVALSHAEYRRADLGWMQDADEGLQRAEAHALRALSLADTGSHARAHAQLARVYSSRREIERAHEEAKRAVELNPSDSVTQYAHGAILIWLGRLEDGIAALEMARRFDPAIDDVMLPLGYYAAGRYVDAVRDAEGRIALQPEVVLLHAVRAAALAQLGRDEQAAAGVQQVKRLAPFARVEAFGTALRNPEHRARLHEGLRKAGL